MTSKWCFASMCPVSLTEHLHYSSLMSWCVMHLHAGVNGTSALLQSHVVIFALAGALLQVCGALREQDPPRLHLHLLPGPDCA